MTDLIPLTTLGDRVRAYADLCCPDYAYSGSDDRNLQFIRMDVEQHADVPNAPDEVGMLLADKGHVYLHPHMFTKWSRNQLLSHMGTREKWFGSVDLDIQADELNRRLHTFEGYRFRTMRVMYSDVRVVRGLVSSRYGDIPDTRIMEILEKLLPEGWAIRALSGKTDRALYVYAITRDEVHIPKTTFKAFPGVVVKNSEVAYSSLWVYPMLYVPRHASALVLQRNAVLRKVHRGQAKELEKEFKDAMDEVSGSWGTLDQRLDKLRKVFFASEDEALAKMRELLLSAGASKSFALRCKRTYEAAGHQSHTGLTVCEAILEQVSAETDKNDAFTHATTAGAVLLKLIQ